MIPPRSLNGENSGNAVKYRVAACRKRLRTNRISPRLQADIQLDEQLSAIVSPSTMRADSYLVASVGAAGFEWPGSREQEEADRA